MSRLGTYHLARIVKLQVSSEEVLTAIRESSTIAVGGFNWTFSDYQQIEIDDATVHFARLTKYLAQGPIPTMDESTHTTIVKITPDMVEASSPFVFLPEYSGIGFLHIWNKIEEQTFRKRFRQLLVEKYRGFFADCSLEPISDLRTFLAKLNSIQSFDRLYAKVNPPNPAFGHLWRDLNDYMERRQTDELTIDETSSTALLSELKAAIRELAEEDAATTAVRPPLPIGDAAIMMAVDGYGRGKVEGRSGTTKVIVSTADNAIVIKLPSEPEPVELFRKVRDKLRAIEEERQMEHK